MAAETGARIPMLFHDAERPAPLPVHPGVTLSPKPPMHADNEMFIDRRQSSVGGASSPQGERRQFANSHQELSPEAARLGRAIDQYKLLNRRRFITYEEMLGVIKSLGYVQQEQGIL